MTRTYQLVCLSEALSPLTHMRGVSGNEALVMREPVVTSRGVTWVPALSGNALRHRLVRAPGWRWLINRWGLQLTLLQLNYALHGGNLTEGGGREDMRRIADMQRLFPLSRLVGGSLPDQIVPGALDVWRGRLVCEENRPWLEADLPTGWVLPEGALRPAESFVSGYQYVRGDARTSAVDLVPANGDPDGGSQMIFSGQAVTTGSCFVHGFTLRHVSELELGALLWSLSLWQAAGGTVGGQGARGHGRLHTSLHLPDGVDGAAAVDAYLAHADAAKEEGTRWLEDVFARPKERASRG